jgi:hypothetical protein
LAEPIQRTRRTPQNLETLRLLHSRLGNFRPQIFSKIRVSVPDDSACRHYRWIPVTTTSTIVLTPTADPPGQIGGTGHYNSPRGCTGDFVTTGNATVNTIDATFDGIDCDDGSGVRLPFSGRIRVTNVVTVRSQVAGTCESEERCLRHRQSGDTTPRALSSATSASTSSTVQKRVLAFDVPAPGDGYMKTQEPLPHS